MENLESTSERLNTSHKGSLKTERELSHLKSNTKLSNLKSEIKKFSNAGKFEFKNISRDGKYKVYLYTIEKHGTPSVLKYQTVKRGIAKSKDQIKITNKDGIEYEESHRFFAGDKVYIKIEIKTQEKTQATTHTKPQIKPNPKTIPQVIEINQSNTGKFEYKNISIDGKSEVYSYIVDQSTTTQGEILNKAKKELNLKNDARGFVTNSKGDPYDPRKIFKVGEKIYLKIPVSIENNTQIIDGMKRKGGEYFGIDISKFNEDIDLEKFKKWNRQKWDSEKTDTRGVSFVYIRASDGKTEDPKVKNHVNKIKEYNNDKTIKDNHEQIAVGFYHRINSYTAKIQAETFLRTYKKYKDTAGGSNLVPMLDIEGGRIKNSTKEDVRNKALAWLQIVEEKTGIIPGIYVTRSIYREYFLNDNRFNKYLTRIAAYPDSDKITKREIGTAKSIDFKKGTVDVGKSIQQIIKPKMYQSSQEGTVDGAYAIQTENPGKKNEKKYHDTDMDHTKNITKLFSKNNKSK